MPNSVVKTKDDELKWSNAKKIARKKGLKNKKFWRYVMGTYMKMKGKGG
jgi:hypothetical protein